MEHDVRIFLLNISSLSILYISLLVSSAVDTDHDIDEDVVVEVVAYNTLYDDHVFIEIVEPDEIAYIYRIRQAKDFGFTLNSTLIRIELVLSSPVDACSQLNNSYYIRGNVALVERGSCSFMSKAIISEAAGAVALIIADNDYENDDTLVEMVSDGTSRTTILPSFYLSGKDGYMIRKTLKELDLSYAIINIPINITGSLSLPKRLPPWSLW